MESKRRKKRPEHNKNKSIKYWNNVFLRLLLLHPYFSRLRANSDRDNSTYSNTEMALYRFSSFFPFDLAIVFGWRCRDYCSWRELLLLFFSIHHRFVINYIIVESTEISSGILQHHDGGLEVERIGRLFVEWADNFSARFLSVAI